MKTFHVEVGKHALNLFIVARARFTHEEESAWDLATTPCFVLEEQAIKCARECHRSTGLEHCVYKLTDVYTSHGGTNG